MKTWFAKLRISAAVDAGWPLSPTLRATIARSEELRRFEETAAGLGYALRNSAPQREAPPELHRSIMRAVRAANRAETPRHPLLALRWLAAPTLAVLVLMGGLWWARNRSAAPPTVVSAELAPPWSVAAAALEQGRELARTAPAVALAPLAEELARTDRDVRSAAQFLLASLP